MITGGAPGKNEGTGIGQASTSGRELLAWNVLTSWMGYVVFVIAGFIMPRVIDRHIGQDALGVWDFGWSLVSYLNLTPLGIGWAVNRYVARYRSRNDADGLCRTVSSAMFVQMIAAAVTVGLTVAATWAVPLFLRDEVGLWTREARVVVFLLGLSVCARMSLEVFRGVMTGCHRWDLHNAINSAFYAVTVTAMITALVLGGGLRSLALANLCGAVLSEVTRAVVAFRVCPELRLRWLYVSWKYTRPMLGFGIKSVVLGAASLVLYQSSSILIAAYLGPSALALYSRPIALVRHVNTIVAKYAQVLIPTTSSLQVTGRGPELQAFMTETGRFGAFVAIPMILGLTIMGNPILRLWMGSSYEQGLLLAILAVGHLLPITQEPVMNIVIGMNVHGRAGVANAVAALGAVVLGFVTIGYLGWGLLGAAVSATVPLTIANGIYLPMYACRLLELPLRHYVLRAFGAPVLCAIPLAAVLGTSRVVLVERPLVALGWGSVLGAVILAPLYWRYILPPRVRERVLYLAGKAFRRLGEHRA